MAQSPDINEPAFVVSRCAAGVNVQAVLDRPNEMHLLVDGAVEISARASGREAQRLAIDRPGSVIAPKPQAGATTVIECVARRDAVILSFRPGVLASDADDARGPMAQAASCRQIDHLVENARLAKEALARRMQAFEERTNLEQLVALFISTFVGVEPHDFDAAIECSMALLSSYFNADQIAYYRLDEGSLALDRVIAWPAIPAKEASSKLELPIAVSTDAVAWLWQQMTERELLVHSGLARLPPEAASLRNMLMAAAIGSFICVPTQSRGKVAGFLLLASAKGQWAWESDALAPLRIVGDVVASALARKDVSASLYNLANFDSLTGLANRAQFHDRLMQARLRARRTQSRFGILLVRVDRFSRIIEGLGYNAGDRLLAAMARRLQSVVRKTDTLARLDGDEFALIAEDLHAVADVDTPARSLLASVRDPMLVDGRELYVSASIGVAMYPDHSDDIGSLKKMANAAMQEASRTGGNGFRVHYGADDGGKLQRLTLESELMHAIERRDLVVHCQPKVWTKGGDFAGGEALVRWRHPCSGMIAPGTFLPIAEESGQIVQLSEYVLEEACRQRKTWPDCAAPPSRIAVNAHSRWLCHPQFVPFVRATLCRHAMPGEWLEIEITEDAVLGNVDSIVASLNQLRGDGITVALDDFGTGYSSLSYLRRLPVDTLKIDRSFIVDIVENSKDAAVVDAIIRLAHTLDLNVVAEGIECDSQNALMDDLGCDMSQGFLLCKPLPCDDFRRWLDARADGGRALSRGTQKAAGVRTCREPHASKDIN